MTKKLRAAVIGLGVGEQHIEGYQAHPDCQVVALCDVSEEKRKMAQEKYPGIRITGDPDEILQDKEIDVVSVASYDNHHHEQVTKAIENGKHVFVEKPVCLHEREARQIRALLKSRPEIKISSNLILRMSPRFRLLKEMVTRGRLGEIFYMEGDYNYGRLDKITEGWRGKIGFYSVVYGGGVHLVDLLLWLTGDDRVTEVVAYGNQIASRGSKFQYNDLVVSLLRFESGLIAKITVNMGCVHPHFHPLAVYGTKGTFINRLEVGFFFKSRDPLERPERIEAAYPGVHKGNLIPSFIDSILRETPPEVSEEDIFKVMSVCFAMEEASQKGRPVVVEYI